MTNRLRRALVPVLLLLAACAAPIDVRRAEPVDVYREVTAYALNSGELSADTRATLARTGLDALYEEDPVAAIRALHAKARDDDRRERLYALAETSQLTAERTGDRSLFLASAVYSWLYLFGGGDEPPPGPFRQRFRRACDLYNVAVARAFSDAEGDEFAPETGRVTLPAGAVDVEVPPLPLHIQGFAYDELHPAINMQVEGFRARAVRSGLGAPLVARRREGTALKERRAHLASNSALAVTALLRVEGELEDLDGKGVHARLEFFRPTEEGRRETQIAGREVPIEFDVTAPLAWELDESKPWEREFSGFFDKDDADIDNEVLLTEPYQPGRIPVVFVHGTASSPARWAEVLNELHSDGLVAGRCQFWIYQYGSGAPILASAAGLRRGLARVVHDVDPKGEDDALKHMVVIGHSQGGLLTRLMVTESGSRFWDTISETPFDDLELSDSTRKYMRPVFFFEPSPYVGRAVFVATPHCGSYVAGSWIGGVMSSLVSMPKAVVRGAGRLAKRAADGSEINMENFSTAVDDMTPGSPFLGALAASPLSPNVVTHSIVAAEGDGPHEQCDDGVVQFTSAHLDCASTEVVVPCGHSCQGHPMVVAEIRRILREHLLRLPKSGSLR